MSTLLDAGLLFLLRFALDDSVEGVISAAVHALKELLVCAEDEVRASDLATFGFIWTCCCRLSTVNSKRKSLDHTFSCN